MASSVLWAAIRRAGARATAADRDRSWRHGFFLVYLYGVVGLCTLAVFPSSVLVTLVTGSHRVGHRLHARLWGRLILSTCGVRLRVHGLERLERGRAYVLMANHGSHFDGFAIAAALPLQWRAVLDAWVRRVPVFGWIGMLAGHVFLERGRSPAAIATLNRAIRQLDGGISVLIFPEGAFNDTGVLRPFKRGGFHLAVRAAVPIVPLTVVETRAGRAGRVVGIDLHVGEPIDTAGCDDEAIPALMARVEAEMSRLLPGVEQEWVEIQVKAADETAAEVAGSLVASGGPAAAGVEIRPGAVVLWATAADAARALAEVRGTVARLERCGAPVRAADVQLGPAAPEGRWRDAWKRYFPITRVGARIVLVPSWETHAAAPGEVVIGIDPGRAFGTGAHPTTRLCLLELERLAAARPAGVRRILDCGTGSGILAIAAAKLWPAARVLALDVDGTAVEVAAENARRNAVDDRVRLAITPAAAVEERFDVVVANIEREPLLGLRDTLTGLVAPGGALVLSGLLAAEAADVARAYAARPGLEVVRIASAKAETEWSAVVLRAEVVSSEAP
jgi:ribosomal protein L11 methyltransferase